MSECNSGYDARPQRAAACVSLFRGRARTPVSSQAFDARRGGIAANIAKLPAFAKGIANRTHIRACESLSGKPVEQQWKTCCSRQNSRDVLFIWSRAEERGACRPVDTALSFKSFRAILGRAFFYFRPFFCQSIAARVSSDNPRLKAFCRVAPSVLFKVRAIVAARVLLFASFFNVRTSFAVQVRLRLFMLWFPR
jgi:hypothetical protein